MEQRRPCIGIDLGTAYTRTASFDGNQIKMIPDQFGESAMPSYVTFTDSGVLIGRAARTQAPQNPANTIFDVIRLIGTRYSDPSVQNDMRLWPFKVVAGPDDMLLVEVHWKGKLYQFTPVEIYSMILTQIKENAQAAIGAPIRDAAVTVPALFDYQQRQAIKEAGMIAGLNILQIVSSPAATALYYGLERSYRSTNMFNNIKRIVLGSDPVEHNIIIFDLGAGTLDVAVVTIKGNACKVQATAGDVHLGGADFDNNLVEYFVNSLKLMSGREDISISPSAISNLRMLCEEAKISLSSGSLMAPIKIAALYSDVDLDSSITEAEFIELNSDLFSKCIRIVDTCLMDAGISIDTVHEVILVGASTRIPIIQNCMKRWFPDKTLTHSQNLEATTSYGVALQAFFLSTRDNWKGYSLSLQDATPFSLGIKGSQGTMCILVPKNTDIPFKMERTFRLTRNSFLLEAYEGEGTLVSTNKLIGKFELSAVHIAQNWNNIKICFEMLENGTTRKRGSDGAFLAGALSSALISCAIQNCKTQAVGKN